MNKQSDQEQIPLLWINLSRAGRRRARMEWAIQEGGWKAHRIEAVDGTDQTQRLVTVPNILKKGTNYPGLHRANEVTPNRKTSRGELACLASWKRMIVKADKVKTRSGWILMMEDDVGASLAVPRGWEHTLTEVINYCPEETMAIQLSPISSNVRRQLAKEWKNSGGGCLAVSKELIRSHGNGAVLLRKKAVKLLKDPLLLIASKISENWQPMLHPWKIRPVADKWIYGALPPGSCKVATYPHFCLEAEDSSIHNEHIENIHKPSRKMTLELWDKDQRYELIKAQEIWDNITK